VLRAVVEIRSGRPKPVRRRNILQRSAAGRGIRPEAEPRQ
jgi:hypothetical protein